MIGSIILAALLAALFWGVITGRLRLPDVEEPLYVAIDPGAPDDVEAAVFFRAPEGGVIEVVHVAWGTPPARHVRVSRRPFDWSQHADL